MSDDSKDKKDPPASDGSGTGSVDTSKSAVTIPFGELLGTIDSRIQSILDKNGKGSTGESKSDSGTPGAGDPTSVRDQLRAELAKLQGEEAAAKKEVDRDVTIAELKEQVAKITEGAPVQEVSRLTKIMWGGKKKS